MTSKADQEHVKIGMSCWKWNANLVAMTTYLGRHAEVQVGPYVPTISSEVKRRCLATVFFIDKIVAAFTGRPPLLSGKYMSTPLPLDLSDEELLLPPSQLSVVVSRLNDRGWCTDGVIKPSTMLRARAMMAQVRDEILEVSLGHEKNVSADVLL